MTDRDITISTAAIALQRSGRMSGAALRNFLIHDIGPIKESISINDIMDLAGVSRAEINGTTTDTESDIKKGLSLSIDAIPISSERYPNSLRTISDAPPVIFCRGDINALNEVPGVAVVGTRKATPHGLRIAERLSEFLSMSGWSVVSGLAMGIDAAAHEGAIKGSTPTIAVLAHGLEKASPTMNKPLAERIIEGGGCWISEHPYGAKALPANFVLRNRIQVGLACASVIIEGEEKSGSKTQAEFCLRNHRTLFAVLALPGSRVSTLDELPKMLVAQRGAIPIFSKEDYSMVLEIIAKKKAQMSLEKLPS